MSELRRLLDAATPDVAEALVVLRADGRDEARTAAWRYGVRHAVSVIENALAAAPAATDPCDHPAESHYRVCFDCGEVDGPCALAQPSEPGLDAAWAEAEAALPEGWVIEGVRRSWFEQPPRWWAIYFRPVPGRNTDVRDGPSGHTPAAALRALAAALRQGVGNG